MSSQGGEVHGRRERYRHRRRRIDGGHISGRGTDDARDHRGNAVAASVTLRAAHRAYRPWGRRRIRRHAHRANIVGALIAIDRHVGIEIDRLRATHAVALVLHAIAGCLHARGRTGSRIVDAAASHGTSSGLTVRIHSRTICRRDALHARTRAVAQRASLRTHRPRSRRRIRRHACRANVVGALIHVDVDIAIVIDGLRPAHAIALIALAIARRLHARGRACGRIVDTACARGARTGLAFRIHSRTLARDIALHALPGGIAERTAGRTCGIDRLGRMHGHSHVACIVRTLIAVIGGHIGVIRDGHDEAHSIALVALAVSGRLTSHHRSRRLIIEAANSASTCAGLAFVIHSGTRAGHRALRRRHTGTVAVTLRAIVLIARSSRRQIRMRRRSGRANFIRTLVTIVHRSVIVVDGPRRNPARTIALIRMAIADHRIASDRPRGSIIESAHRAVARPGLANCIHSGTVHRHVALHARSHRITDRSAVFGAHRARHDWRMRWTRRRITAVGGARVVIGRRNGILHRPEHHVARRRGAHVAIFYGQIGPIERTAHTAHAITNVGFAIIRRLGHQNHTLRRVRETTHTRRAGAGLAFRISSCALRGLRATCAIAHSVALEHHIRATGRPRHAIGIRRDAIGTDIVRAIVVVDRHVRCVIRRDNFAGTVALIDFAVARRLPGHGWGSGCHECRPAHPAIARSRYAFIRRCRAISRGLAGHTTAASAASAAHTPGARSTPNATRTRSAPSAAHTPSSARTPSSTCTSQSAAATATATAAARVATIGRLVDVRAVNRRDQLARTQRECGCRNQKVVRPAHCSFL